MSQSASTAEPRAADIASADPDQWYFLSGSSPRMAHVRTMMEQVAGYNTSVLITGEPGTGKEAVARYIHASSPRSNQPFVPVNCGAIPPDLLERELFGHEEGDSTGAASAQAGCFAAAEGGTLFLDEVGDMSLPLQAKLLRVLQERVHERVGSDKSRACDVRIIAATRRDVESAIREARFREDLYYRLNGFSIELPPLRERLDDLPELVGNLLARHERAGLAPIQLTPGALRVLRHCDWPGNTRELANLLERLCMLNTGSAVDIADLPERYVANAPVRNSDHLELAITRAAGPQPQDFDLPSDGLPLKQYLERVEVALIRRALYESRGVVAHAARRLKVRRTTLAEKMKRYGLTAA